MPKLGKLERDIDAQIGDRIRARRVALGLSQADLASMIGMSFQQVQKYERGSNRIASSILLRVSVALQCSASYFLGTERSLKSDQQWLADLAADKEISKVLRQFSEVQSAKSRRKILTALKAALKDAKADDMPAKPASPKSAPQPAPSVSAARSPRVEAKPQKAPRKQPAPKKLKRR